MTAIKKESPYTVFLYVLVVFMLIILSVHYETGIALTQKWLLLPAAFFAILAGCIFKCKRK